MNHNGRYAEAIGKRVMEFQGFSPRELAIYLSGQEDGANIKNDEVQPDISMMETLMAENRDINGPVVVTFR